MTASDLQVSRQGLIRSYNLLVGVLRKRRLRMKNGLMAV